MILGLVIELDEGRFVLGEVLYQDVPEGFGLLRAKVNALMILNAELIGALGVGLAENEMKIPDADADLDAVGVGVAVSRGLDHVDAWLGRVLAHSVTRLLWRAVKRRLAAWLGHLTVCISRR